MITNKQNIIGYHYLKKTILISRKDMKYKVILFHVKHLIKVKFYKLKVGA